MTTVFLGGASNGNWIPLFLFFVAVVAFIMGSVKGIRMLVHFIRSKKKRNASVE